MSCEWGKVLENTKEVCHIKLCDECCHDEYCLTHKQTLEEHDKKIIIKDPIYG